MMLKTYIKNIINFGTINFNVDSPDKIKDVKINYDYIKNTDKQTHNSSNHYNEILKYIKENNIDSLHKYLKLNINSLSEWLGYYSCYGSFTNVRLEDEISIDILIFSRARTIEIDVLLIFLESPEILDKEKYIKNIDNILIKINKILLVLKRNKSKIEQEIFVSLLKKNSPYAKFNYRPIVVMGRKNNISLEEKRLLLEEKNIDLTNYDRIFDNLLYIHAKEILTKKELTIHDYNYLLKSTFDDIKIELCSKYKIPEGVLGSLVNNKSDDIRKAVALSSYQLPHHIIKKLSDDKKLEIRKIIALSPYTPKEIFLNIKGIYSDLLQRKDCPTEVFQKLINIEELQTDIAQHNNLKSQKIINKLLSLNNYEVDKMLIQNQNINLDTKQQIAYRLSESNNHQDRRFIAKYSFAPKEILYNLCIDENWLVRQHVLKNKNVPKDIITKLLDDEDHIVRRDALLLSLKESQKGSATTI